MQVQVLEQRIVGYGAWGKPGDEDAPRWRSGAAVEWVSAQDSEGNVRQFTLDESINGTRADVGAVVDLVADVTIKQDVVYNRSGRERIISRDKWRVTGMAPVPAGKS